MKGMRKVWAGLITLANLDLLYIFFAPHDSATFNFLVMQIMAIFTALAVTLTAEHHKSMQEEAPKTPVA